MSNNDNYGTYGRFCDFGEICKNDQCKCPDGGNVGTVSNCGYCGNYCLATPGSEVNCKNGKCVSRCSNPVNTNCGTDQVADYTSLQEDEIIVVFLVNVIIWMRHVVVISVFQQNYFVDVVQIQILALSHVPHVIDQSV